MKKLIALIILTFTLSAWALSAQTVQQPVNRGRVEVSINQNFLYGNTHNLMGFAAAQIGYNFSENLKAYLDASFGRSLVDGIHKTQVYSLMLAHEHMLSDKAGIQFGAGPALLRDLQDDGSYKTKPAATLEIQQRLYLSTKSFVGFSAKAFIGKECTQGSFIGVSWGSKF